MKFLAKFFRNNGHLRGGIYIACAVLPILTADLALLGAWLMQHRHKLTELTLTKIDVLIVAVVIARFAFGYASTGFVTIRAFLDQHMSRASAQTQTPPTQ